MSSSNPKSSCCGGETVWVLPPVGGDPQDEGVCCADCGEWQDFHMWSAEHRHKVFPFRDPASVARAFPNKVQKTRCDNFDHSPTCDGKQQPFCIEAVEVP